MYVNYLAHDDATGKDVEMYHSASDLRIHHWAGVGAAIIFVLMLVAIIALALN